MGKEPRNPRVPLRALTGALALVLVLGLLPEATAQLRFVSVAPKREEPPAAPAYVDRLIEGLAPGSAEVDAESPTYNRDGWPRYLRLETRLGTQPFDDRKLSAGVNAVATIETPNHGAITIDTGISPDDGSHLYTIRQRGLPIAGGWSVNNDLGVFTPLPPGILRLPSRIFLPSVYTRGAGTEWADEGSRTLVSASSGEPGRLSGYPVPGFVPLDGLVSTVAAQRSMGAWTAAARFAHADGISRFDSAAASDFIDSDSTQVAVRHAAGEHVVQANLLSTRSSETRDTRKGFWLDGEWKGGTSSVGYGAFRLDPLLGWAGQTMANDVEGAYARGAWRTRQWSAESSIDLLRSVAEGGDTGVLLTTTGRWRYSRALTLGAGGTLRRFNGNAGTAHADARWQGDWGITGARIDYSSNLGERATRFALDHGWLLPAGWVLNTGATLGRERGSDRDGTIVGGALSFAAPLRTDLTLNGNATTERQGNGDRFTSASANLSWRIARAWSLEASYIRSVGRVREVRPIDPLAPLPDPVVTSTGSRSVFLALRFEDQAGSSVVPLGGSRQGGGGKVEGVVFLDTNRNGLQEAGELGAAGVTVFLDGRYAVRTDSQGRFEFPFVGAGTRVIRVVNETLPLPWEAGDQAETRVDVPVRDTVSVRIPVVRRGAD